jgi:mevalonate pyrophosphate decarboxylase
VLEYEYYELVADSYDYDINGTLIREDDFVKFYYLPDNKSREMKPMVLNASQVSLYFVEKSQKPCWKVITITQIRVNSKTGKVEKKVRVRNELYVPS